ncbi:MAG: sigma 54-interacting transcriptional regulator [Deltaproteobacteria bacterium]|nr:sigma 54-interacting transcriptional regulator [Deltaproteobacteria bacterium]
MVKPPPDLKASILSDQWVKLLDQLNIGAFTIDLDRRITSFNSSVQALMGLEDTDVLGKDCREVFHEIPCYDKCPLSAKRSAETDSSDVEIRDERNASHQITRLTTPLYDPDHNVSGCFTLFYDHSHLANLINRIHYEERSLKIILDNLDIGIFTVNRGGHVTFFNTAAEKITGYNRRDVLGTPCSSLFGGHASEGLDLLMESIADGNPRTNRQGEMPTREGEIIPIRADYLPLQNDQGQIVGGLATLQDLTLAQQLDQVISDRYTFINMVGKDPSMQKIFEMARVVAASDATLLIEGSTGTGKDLLAKVIHSASNRSEKPFVKVNCAALPENLLESEMFGYAKGAFTGADLDKLGRFQEADGGTIFLDEIGDIPLSLQAKLLRVLEDKEFYPLGSRKTIKVDVRIISATNRGLEKLVKKRLFREDLFYRLNVLRIELPLLKDRRPDLPLLIRHIVRQLCAVKGNLPQGISEMAMEALLSYDYPGNVRELENVLEHALIISQYGVIEPRHLPDYLQDRLASPREIISSAAVLSEGPATEEREKIIRVLRQHNGHRGKTARVLGVNRSTLWRKMKKLGLTP